MWNSAEDRLSKKLLQHFHFPYLTAPGEAEAECAALQKCGVVDAVMSQDADAVMFGSTFTLKNWSHEAQRGNHSPTHVDVLYSNEIQSRTGLDTNGMILVALLSGGDYDTTGVTGFGAGIACEIAKVKEPNFAADLLAYKAKGDEQGLKRWREILNHELQTNESKYFKRRHNISVPDNFPDDTVLGYYTNPAVSTGEKMKEIEHTVAMAWAKEIDLPSNIPLLREFTRDHFEWKYKSGARKFIRGMAQSLLAQKLRLKQPMGSVLGVDSVLSRRAQFDHDGIPEVRLQIIPSQIVPVDLSQEEDPPEDLTSNEGEDEVEQLDSVEGIADSELISSQGDVPMTPSKKRKSPPWNPDVHEKYWLPEAIVKMGLSGVLAEWDLQQEELRKDPKKWATRKIKPKVKDAGMKQGAMDAFFKTSKPGLSRPMAKAPSTAESLSAPITAPRRPQPGRSKPSTKRPTISTSRKDRSIAQFFQPHAQTSTGSSIESVRAMHTSSTTTSSFSSATTMEDLSAEPPSPSPRRIRVGYNLITTSFDNNTSTPIEIPSSPLTSMIPPSTKACAFEVRDTSTPEPQHAGMSTVPPQSSPSGLRGCPVSLPPPAFDVRTSQPLLQARENINKKARSMRIQKPTSPSSTVGSIFRATKSNKVVVTSRESLPGAWKEIDQEDVDYVDSNGGMDREMYRRQRVSLVNMTS